MNFADLYADEYDALYNEKNYQEECNLIEAASLKFGGPPATILDIGCGTGSHSLELAKRGYQCTGIDLSPAMLTLAAYKSDAANPAKPPRWIEGNIMSFDAPGNHDLAIMMFAVVGYLTSNDDVLKGLRNVRKHLKSGSLFVCDFWYGPAVLSVRPEDRVRIAASGDRRIMRAASTKIDSFNHTADVTFRLWKVAGEAFVGETVEVHKMRYYFPQEFRALLSQAGFESLSMSEFPSLDVPLTDQSWNALSIARAI
jgi:SAM-dependent methyltransferase